MPTRVVDLDNQLVNDSVTLSNVLKFLDVPNEPFLDFSEVDAHTIQRVDPHASLTSSRLKVLPDPCGRICTTRRLTRQCPQNHPSLLCLHPWIVDSSTLFFDHEKSNNHINPDEAAAYNVTLMLRSTNTTLSPYFPVSPCFDHNNSLLTLSLGILG